MEPLLNFRQFAGILAGVLCFHHFVYVLKTK